MGYVFNSKGQKVRVVVPEKERFYAVQVFQDHHTCLGDLVLLATSVSDAKRQARRKYPNGELFYATEV